MPLSGPNIRLYVSVVYTSHTAFDIMPTIPLIRLCTESCNDFYRRKKNSKFQTVLASTLLMLGSTACNGIVNVPENATSNNVSC
jgi:hypothetical protein